MNNSIRLFTVLVILCAGAGYADTVLIEAESFDSLGGWVVDQQAIDQMGSAYVLAHGLGKPVGDASTVVEFASTGRYHVWIRTRDWVGPWRVKGAPGKFQLLVEGRPLVTQFGTEGAEWHWQGGGVVDIAKTRVAVALDDLTGFEGRCDAIVFTTDSSFVPPNEVEALSEFRKRMLNLPDHPVDAGRYDLVVVGGGIAGTCTAVSAARLGLEVALLQNRPVLGGNNSSEVRVHLNGEINLPPYPALGDVVRELDGGFRGNARPANHYDDDRKLRVVEGEKNVHLFLDTHAYKVEMKGDEVAAVIARNTRTSRELRFGAPLFVDCTGDGTIGYLAGGDYRMGRESRTETGETLAPEEADKMTMGMSVQWYSGEAEEATEFPDCSWGVQFNQQSCQPVFRGDWNWEAGMNRNQITEAEYIRDYSLRVIYGNWAFMKNHSEQKAKYANLQLDWVAYVGGKRESRRLMGDLILCQQDIQQDTIFDDAFVTATWTIDLHYPNPQNTKHFPGEEFRSIAEFGKKNPYPIPYRCFYSRNVPNLFMAGRNISVTHVALGTVRVMRTCGMMGEVVGMAASLCKKHDATPREVYEKHLDELKGLARKGVGKLPRKTLASIPPEWLAKGGENFARKAKLKVSSCLDEEKYRPAVINDGKIDIRNNDTRWVSERAMPQWIEFTWDKPVTFNAARILTGWSQGVTTYPRDVIRDFSFQYYEGAEWKDIAAVTASHRFDWNGMLPKTTTRRIRLNITSAGGETARLWEVEFYRLKEAANAKE
jgi:hypothetical protein